MKITKDVIKTKLKDVYLDKYDDCMFEIIWKNVEDRNQGIVDLIYEIQPYVNMVSSELDFKNGCLCSVNLARFVNIGGDPEYFTSGSGALGSCAML